MQRCFSILDKEDIRNSVKHYYSKVIKKTKDLKTSACCSTNSLPPYLKEVEKKILSPIKEKFYGCGSPIPPLVEGKKILDLGCGTGRDAYLLSYLAGEQGFVLGVDMLSQQIEVPLSNLEEQMKAFGFSRPNIEFRQGYIEDLGEIGIEDNSFDVVISNCVINLSPNKEKVFAEIFRVLKEGGELYFSDIFSDRRIPLELQKDEVLLGECLGGALYIEDFRRLLNKLGCSDYRIVNKRKLEIDNPEIKEKVGLIDFYSLTIRAFKIEGLEDICEDYGQIAIYKGTIPHFPHYFPLDDHHLFITKKPQPVCGNTADMLNKTRFQEHFQIIGDKSIHYGKFSCQNQNLKVSLNSSCC